MKTIEQLRPKKRQPETLVVVWADGEEEALSAEVVDRFALSSGRRLNDQELEAIRRLNEEVRCRQAAWRLISLRPRSQTELVRALCQRKFPVQTARLIVERLVERGYVDDRTFASLFVQERLRRRQGIRAIEMELKKRGISREEAAEALEGASDPDEQRENARALLEKWSRRSKPEDPRKRQQAAAQFLFRRGYEPDVVWELVRDVIKGRGEED